MAFCASYHRLAVVFAGIIALGVLAGCAPVLAVPAGASRNAPIRADANSVYLLNVGDTVKLTVYGEDGLTGSYMIDANGVITVPLIGDVKAAGLSRDDLQKDITTRLVQGEFMTKPLVTVDATAVRPFYIVGEVKNPGSYPWQPSLDALKAIATAGGYTPRAATNKILIDRAVATGGGQDKVRMNATEDTAILPGDSIIVRERIF